MNPDNLFPLVGDLGMTVIVAWLVIYGTKTLIPSIIDEYRRQMAETQKNYKDAFEMQRNDFVNAYQRQREDYMEERKLTRETLGRLAASIDRNSEAMVAMRLELVRLSHRRDEEEAEIDE